MFARILALIRIKKIISIATRGLVALYDAAKARFDEITEAISKE